MVKQQIEEFGLGGVIDKVVRYGCIMPGDWQKKMHLGKKEEIENDIYN